MSTPDDPQTRLPRKTREGTSLNFRLLGQAHHHDEEDPLGILGGRASHTTRVDLRRAPPDASGEWESAPLAKLDCSTGDPCAAVDEILRASKSVRDRVSLRQAQAVGAYLVETNDIKRELALLPQTCGGRLLSRQRLKTRPQQRTATTAEEDVRHPLNFHLRGAGDASAAPEGGNDANHHAVEGHGRAGCGSPSDQEEGENEDSRNRRSWKGGTGGDGAVNDGVPKPESTMTGREGNVDEGAATKQVDRKFSTRARSGSATERPLGRRVASSQPQVGGHRLAREQKALAPRRTERCPFALQRHKLRARCMVFSLLEAAYAEEEAMVIPDNIMEDTILECSTASGDQEAARRCKETSRELDRTRLRHAGELEALMMEYDPRPTKSRGDRKPGIVSVTATLPLPDVSDVARMAVATGPGSTAVSPSTRPHTDPGTDRRSGKTNAYGGGSRAKNTSEHQEAGAPPSNTTLHESAPLTAATTVIRAAAQAPQMSPIVGQATCVDVIIREGPETASGPRDGSRQIEYGEAQNVHDGTDGCVTEDRPAGDANPRVQRSGGPASARREDPPKQSEIVSRRHSGPVSCGYPLSEVQDARGAEMSMDMPLPFESEAAEDTACTDDGVGRHHPDGAEHFQKKVDAGDVGEMSASLCRSPTAGQSRKLRPTLPDPNEVNDVVMADILNMDHLKDLPGLKGGRYLGLSEIVSASVVYTDPAFPNLEFHRRSANDKAGYFMPGYKPRVNSPGQDAGAYWLERRQSYRVKMAAPTYRQEPDTRPRQHDQRRRARGHRSGRSPQRRSAGHARRSERDGMSTAARVQGVQD